MPEITPRHKRLWVSPDELRSLHRERLRCLDHVAEHGALGGFVPASDRNGWSATIQPLRRDPRGALLARIVVRAPHLTGLYVRNVRLVTEEPLPRSLSSGWRET